jgi:predicted TIM-barrel fold metal-dependent hydrolase
MDMPANNEVRDLRFDKFHSGESLVNATRQAHQRKYNDFLIVDVDAHHYENESYKEVFEYISSPVVKHTALESVHRGGRASFLGGNVGYQDLSGRITRHWLRGKEKIEAENHRDIVKTTRWMDAMGVDYCCLFPTPMLFLGTHPQPEIEAEMAMAYNRWLCERILAHEPRIISMLYLPLNDPDAAYRTVKEFGGKKGVVGFMITSPRYKPVHDNAFIKTYALLEEMNLPLSFHAAYSWNDQSLALQNRFIGVHALGFMWFNMVHMTNWIVNGMPERFPKLRTMWIESGLTWAYCLAQRLDHSYMMRTSECPSLKRKPSEYMQEMFFSTQPMEMPEDKSILEATFKMIKAETQLCWASDYPHWDFDLPSTIYDLPFLNETGKRNILGANAERFFGRELPKKIPKVD